MSETAAADGAQAVPAAYRKPDYAEIASMETQLGMPHSAPVAQGLLNRDLILKASRLKTEELYVPEWGGTIFVREMRGRERDEWEASLRVQRGDQVIADTANLRAKLCARTIVGPDGEPLFTQQDVAALGELSAAALDRVYEVAARLSRLNPGAVEEAGKTSAGTLSGDSASA